MKRFFAILMSCMLLFGSVSYAKSFSNDLTISKTDAQILFGEKSFKNQVSYVQQEDLTPNNNVALLDNSEMKNTEGEWWFFLIAIRLLWPTPAY